MTTSDSHTSTEGSVVKSEPGVAATGVMKPQCAKMNVGDNSSLLVNLLSNKGRSTQGHFSATNCLFQSYDRNYGASTSKSIQIVSRKRTAELVSDVASESPKKSYDSSSDTSCFSRQVPPYGSNINSADHEAAMILSTISCSPPKSSLLPSESGFAGDSSSNPASTPQAISARSSFSHHAKTPANTPTSSVNLPSSLMNDLSPCGKKVTLFKCSWKNPKCSYETYRVTDIVNHIRVQHLGKCSKSFHLPLQGKSTSSDSSPELVEQQHIAVRKRQASGTSVPRPGLQSIDELPSQDEPCDDLEVGNQSSSSGGNSTRQTTSGTASTEDSGEEADFYYTEEEVSINDVIRKFSSMNTTPTAVTSPIGGQTAVVGSAPYGSQRPVHHAGDHDYQRKYTARLEHSTSAAVSLITGGAYTGHGHHGTYGSLPSSLGHTSQIGSLFQQHQHGGVQPIHSQPHQTAQPGPGGSNAVFNAPMGMSPASYSMLVRRQRARSDVKKCRKVYGMENRELWCTQCKWKKACTRFSEF